MKIESETTPPVFEPVRIRFTLETQVEINQLRNMTAQHIHWHENAAPHKFLVELDKILAKYEK